VFSAHCSELGLKSETALRVAPVTPVAAYGVGAGAGVAIIAVAILILIALGVIF